MIACVMRQCIRVSSSVLQCDAVLCAVGRECPDLSKRDLFQTFKTCAYIVRHSVVLCCSVCVLWRVAVCVLSIANIQMLLKSIHFTCLPVSCESTF